MVLTRRFEVLVVLATGCGWLPPDSPPKAPTPPGDPDLAELAHTWTIDNHVLSRSSALSDTDAAALDGRTVAITTIGYTSPWHGTCEEAVRERQKRALVEVAADVEVQAPARDVAHRYGITDTVVEYKLSCRVARIPPLTIYVAGAHAMTCFGGACYLMKRERVAK